MKNALTIHGRPNQPRPHPRLRPQTHTRIKLKDRRRMVLLLLILRLRQGAVDPFNRLGFGFDACKMEESLRSPRTNTGRSRSRSTERKSSLREIRASPPITVPVSGRVSRSSKLFPCHMKRMLSTGAKRRKMRRNSLSNEWSWDGPLNKRTGV